MPCSASSRTTTRCVEIPAWSIPGRYKVLYPRMRCQRVKISISVWSIMCPMCSEPVTFGGGITIENTGPGAFGSARKSCSRTQNSAQRGSICCGSYVLAISRAIRDPAPEHAYTVIAHVDTRAITLIFDYTRRNPAPSIHSKGACWVSLESQSWITSGLRTIHPEPRFSLPTTPFLANDRYLSGYATVD